MEFICCSQKCVSISSAVCVSVKGTLIVSADIVIPEVIRSVIYSRGEMRKGVVLSFLAPLSLQLQEPASLFEWLVLCMTSFPVLQLPVRVMRE